MVYEIGKFPALIGRRLGCNRAVSTTAAGQDHYDKQWKEYAHSWDTSLTAARTKLLCCADLAKV